MSIIIIFFQYQSEHFQILIFIRDYYYTILSSYVKLCSYIVY